MIKFTLILASALTLTGCASNCTEACLLGFGPGNAVFNAIADNADRRDLCQTAEFSSTTGQRLKPQGYQKPLYCQGTNRGQAITDRNGHVIGYIKR
jgi:hypothetical protein